MSHKSNLKVLSNLYLDNEAFQRTPYRFLPGDHVVDIYPQCSDQRVREARLTEKQCIEQEQYLVCYICKRTCAGTCTQGGREQRGPVNTSGKCS